MYKNIGSNNSRGGPYGAHRPLAPASSLQSLIARPSDYSFFSSNQFLDRLSRPSGLRDSVIQSTPLLQRFAKESDQKQTNQQESQLSQPFSAASTSQFQNDRLSVRASSLGVFLNAPPVAPLNQDPRELTSPEWQRHAMARLFEVLAATDFDWQNPKHVFSISHLLPISKHTLEKVFEHFMRTLLFECSLEKLKFEEVAKWARQLGYPYHHMLKKNTLNSPNIPSSGAVVCGFLDWMRETMEIWMSLVNRESKFGTIFKFNISDIEEDPSNESCFHKFRMEFMVAAYLRSCNGRSDVEDLVERFVQQLNERYGDLKTKTEALQAEMNERKDALTERVRNYETLEALNAKYNDIMQGRDQAITDTNENKKNTAHAEREIVAGREKLTAKAAEAANLRAEIAKLEKIVQHQSLKKDKLFDFTKDIENEEVAKAQLLREREKIQGRLEDQSVQPKVQQIRELISNLRQGLADLSGLVTSEGVVFIPDYDDRMEIQEYVTSVKTALDLVVDLYRKQLAEAGGFNKQQEEVFRKLYKSKVDLDEKVKRIGEALKELQNALTTAAIHSEQKCPKDSAFEDEKKFSVQDLSQREANLVKLKDRLKEARHTRLSKDATAEKLQKRLTLHEKGSARRVEEFRQKQEERIGNVEKVAERITKMDQNVKRVVKKCIHEMAEAANKCKERLRGSKE